MMHPSIWLGLIHVSQAATGSLVAAVWQGALLSAATWAGLRLLPKTPAAVRFAVWFAVFATVAALPVMALWQHAGLQAAGGRAAWLTLDARWSVAIAAIWAAASLVRAATLVVAAVRIRALWKRAEVVAIEGAEFLHPTHRHATRMARVCVSDEVDRPSVIGFFAPKILIPRWLLEKLTADELRQVCLHEAGHLGRADDWLNLLQKLALVVFPLNPALAWIERRLCFERELACDERVLAETGAPKAYAACLAALAEYRLGRRGTSLSLALGLAGAGRNQSELGQRVGRILARRAQMRPMQARLVMGGAMLGLIVGAVELARCPQVVGFTAGSSGVMADEARALHGPEPTQHKNAGMNGLPRMQDVAFHLDGPRREASVPQQLMPQNNGGFYGTGKPAPISKTAVGNTAVARSSIAAHKNQAAVVQTSENADGQRRLLAYRLVRAIEQQMARGEQRVVVTSWSTADDSRMTMTSVNAVSEDASQDQVRQDLQDRDHRYAAVPVRGGWLVFQL
jgi:Zn-dependent protease with chaperone function